MEFDKDFEEFWELEVINVLDELYRELWKENVISDKWYMNWILNEYAKR
jgi:hypothetical protein